MKNLFLSLFLSLISIASNSKDTASSSYLNLTSSVFWSFYFERQFSQLTTIDSSVRLENSLFIYDSADKKNIKTELEKAKGQKIQINTTHVNDQIFILHLDKESLVVDFSKFNSGKLVLNNKVFNLKKNKTFYDYFYELQRLQQKKISLHPFINSANATTIEDLKSFYSNVKGFFSDGIPLIVNTLIASFLYSSKFAYQLDESAGKDIIRSLINVYQNESDLFKNSSNFTSRECNYTVSPSGEVKNVQGNCVTKVTNIYNAPPLFQFPKVAEKCCQKVGCFERIDQLIKGISLAHFGMGAMKTEQKSSK